MARLRRAAFVLVLACGTACSLTSLDGYSDGARAEGEGGGPDAGLDARATDAPPGSDGASSPDADAGSGFCATRSALLCSDFDDGQLPGPWTALQSTNATLVADTQLSVSPPRSLLATYPGTGYANGCLQRTITTASTKYVVDFDVFVSGTGGTNFDVFNIERSAARNVGVELYPNGKFGFDEDIPVVDGGPNEILTPVNAVFPKEKWVHFREIVTVTAGGATVDLSLDGTAAASYSANAAVFTAPFTLELGDCTLNTSAAVWRVRYDNFVFDTK